MVATLVGDEDRSLPSNDITMQHPTLPNAQLATVTVVDDEDNMERLRRAREARGQAFTLEMVGDLPFAEVKPPENVLFVCKLNPVTQGMYRSIYTSSDADHCRR